MAIEIKEKLIDGDNYMCTQLPARRGCQLKIKLMRMIGPALAELFVRSKGDINVQEISPEQAEKSVARLLENVTEKEFEELLEKALFNGQVRKNNQVITEGSFDLDFAGRYMTVYKVLWFVIETNFSDFFGAAATTK